MQDRIYKFFAKVAVDRRGLTAMEYAVLGAIVVGGIVAVGASFKSSLATAFTALFSQTSSS